MKLKILKNMLFIACVCSGFLFTTSFYNYISGFSTSSTIKTRRYNSRRIQCYSYLKGRPEKFKTRTEDNIDIAGLIIDQPASDSVLLVCHGYKQSKEHLIGLANLFPDHTVVLFDLRAHGDSSGNLVSFGYHEYKDVCAVVNYLKKDARFRTKNLYGLGISMGAASVANACSKGCKFDGLILDSCFSQLDFDVISRFASIPKLLFGVGKSLFKLICGVDIDTIRPAAFLSTIDCPLMIIHSPLDEKVSIAHAQELFDNAGCKDKLLVQCKGTHGLLFRHDAEAYKKAVIDFLSQH